MNLKQSSQLICVIVPLASRETTPLNAIHGANVLVHTPYHCSVIKNITEHSFYEARKMDIACMVDIVSSTWLDRTMMGVTLPQDLWEKVLDHIYGTYYSPMKCITFETYL